MNIKNSGTLWMNHSDSRRFKFITANADLKSAFEDVLWVNLSDREVASVEVVNDEKLNIPIIKYKGSLAGQICHAVVNGKPHVVAGFDYPTLLTMQIYDALTEVFLDCNTARSKECKTLADGFRKHVLANAIPLSRIPSKK